MISSEIKKEYDEKGFLIVHNAIDSDLAAEVKNHVLWLGEKYPDIRPEAFHHHLLIHDPFIHHLLKSDRLLKIVEKIIEKPIEKIEYRKGDTKTIIKNKYAKQKNIQHPAKDASKHCIKYALYIYIYVCV